MRQRSAKSGSNGSGDLAPISKYGLPSFDLSEYELDPEEEPYEVVGDAIVWNLRRRFEFPGCPKHCRYTNCPNRDKLERGGFRKATFRHVRDGLNRQKIKITIQRWFWTGAPVFEVHPTLPHPGISANHRMTIAAVEFAESELKEGVSPKKIAKDLGVALSTIYVIESELEAKSQPVTENVPVTFMLSIDPEMECIQLDEFKWGEVYYTLILGVSPRKKTFVGIVPGRSGENVIPALKAIFARSKVWRATADFGDYVPILKQAKPDIVITGDKWHFSEKLKEVLADIGKAAAGTLKEEASDLIRKHLIAQASQIADRELRRKATKEISTSTMVSLFEKNINLFRTTHRKLDSERRKDVDFWLGKIPALKEPYKMLQRMYWLRNQEHLSVAEARKRFWKALFLLKVNAPQAYESAVFFFEERWEEVLAYFETRETNARAESLIRRIRIMLSVSGGLTPAELVRRMILKYANGSPAYYFSEKWEPLTARSELLPDLACKEDSRICGSRHGKHASKNQLVEADPANQPSQYNLPLE